MNAELENLVVEQMEIEDRDGVTALPGAAEILRVLPRTPTGGGYFSNPGTRYRPHGICRVTDTRKHDHFRRCDPG